MANFNIKSVKIFTAVFLACFSMLLFFANNAYAAINSNIFISQVKDTGQPSGFNTITWTDYVPTDTSVAVSVRAGNVLTPDAFWTGWNLVSNGGSLDAIDGGRYIQYKAVLTYTDTSLTPNIQDITFNYKQYSTSSQTITSSAYNTESAENVVAGPVWNEDVALPTGTGVTIHLRASSTSELLATTDWAEIASTTAAGFITSGCEKDDTTVTCGNSVIPDGMKDGAGDQWVQYKVELTSTGANTPTLADITVRYVVNAPPDFESAATASQDSAGLVNISYSVRDEDTITEYVTPSFAYLLEDGDEWTTITTGLSASATTTKTVELVNYTTHNLTWTAKTQVDGEYSTTAKIKVIVDDSDLANNTASSTTSAFTLDTTDPTSPDIVAVASTTPAGLSLSASDDSSLEMKIAQGATSEACEIVLSSVSYSTYSTASTSALTTDPATVCVQYKDAYGNTSSIVSATTPETPTVMMIQDTSNIPNEEYRLFVAWKVVEAPTPGFAQYEIYRSTDNVTYSLVGAEDTMATNYYGDSTVNFDTLYYYKVAIVDNNSNTSYFSAVVNGKANGTEDAGEGGGGTETTPPIISNVATSSVYTTHATIAWDTNELSDSRVDYITDTGGNFVSAPFTGVASMVDNVAGVGQHSVTLSGLSANKTYYFQVQSTDPSSNIATSTEGVNGYSFTTLSGPIISNISTSEIDNTQATIVWTTDIVANSYVVYSTSSDLSGSTEAGSATETTSHSVSIAGLTAGTKYYYYVKSGVAQDKNVVDGVITYFTFNTTSDTTAPTITFVLADDVTNITDTSATISWITDELATSTLEYGETVSYGTTLSNNNYNTSHSFNLAGLTKGTTYYIRLKNTDTNGNTAENTGCTFATTDSEDYIAPVISSVAASSVTVSAATAAWTTNESATSTIYYGTSIEYGSSETNSSLNTGHSFTLTELAPSTLYYFKAESADANGNTATDDNGGAGYTFTTADASDTTAPTISAVSSGTPHPTLITITWTTDEESSSLVDFGINTSYGSTQGNSADSTNSHFVTLIGLIPSSLYHFRVKSADELGNLAASGDYTFTTDSPPDPGDVIAPSISDIATSNITANSAAIAWTTDEDSDSVAGYSIDANFNTEKGDMTQTKNHIITVTNLTPSTVYKFRVKSTDANGNLAIDDNNSNGWTFTTLSGADSISPIISNVAVSSIAQTIAVITWTTNENSSSLVDFGTDTSYGSTQGNDQDSVIFHSVTLIGLTSATDYKFRVKTVDAAGNQGLDDNNGTGYAFTTTSDTEAPVITGVAASPVYDTVAVISWTTDESADSKVEYGTVSGNYAESSSNANYNLNHSITLTSLTASAKYYYRVVSADASNNSTPSAEYNFTTLETLSEESDVQAREDAAEAEGVDSVDTTSSGGGGMLIIDKTDKVAPVISDIKISDIKSESVKVSWGTDENADSFVEYGLLSDYGRIHGKWDSVTSHSTILNYLLPATVYHYQISGKDSWGNLARSSDKTFTTLSLVEELEQEIEEELTFEEIEALTEKEKEEREEEQQETAEGLFKIAASAVEKAMNIIKQSASQVSIGALESTLIMQQSSIEDLAKSIPAPLMSGEPRVVTTAKTAAIAWRTDKLANSLVAIAPEDQYNAEAENPYQQVIGNPTAKVVEHAVTIYDLEPDSAYHFQLRNKGSVGPMAQSRDFTFRTEKEILEISNYTIQNISNEEAVFKWVTNVEANSTIKYIPYRNNILAVDEAKTKNNKSITTIHEISINDFEAGVIYEVELISQDISDNTANEKLSAFSTAEDDMPPIISQTQTASALSPGKSTKVQTIISWKTNEPSTTRVYYQKGIANSDQELSEITKLDTNYTKKHVVVITKFDPGAVYSFRAESIDSGGNVSLSKVHAILTPRQKESVFQVIMKNVEEIFGWVGKIKN